MKRTKIFLILFIAVIGLSAINETKAQSVAVNFSLFQQELNPYGRWMTNPRFGEVWIYNDPSFRPYYSDGHWDYTNYGWEWVSDFDWGWAPFHYGRWEYDPSYGWMWIPGYDWGAAWVSWSAYDDYYGWAPLGYGVDIGVGFGSIPYDRWTFIPRANICDRDINRYYISPERNRGFRNAVVINNFYEGNGGRGRFMRGPDRNEAERYTHNRIQERRIDDREREGRWTANNDNGRRNDRNNNNGFNNGGRRNDQQQGGINNNDNNRNNDRNANNINNGGRNNDQQVRGNNDNNRNGNNNWGGRRGNDQNAGNGNQQGNQNVPGRRPDVVDNNRQPNRDVNTNPRQNGNWSNDNRGNRQQNDFPQQRQQVERPSRQQQQQQPAMQQRSMERRDYGGGGQRSNNNGQGNNDNHGGGGGGRNRRG